MIPDDEQDQRFLLWPDNVSFGLSISAGSPWLAVTAASKQPQIDLEDRLEQSHIGALIQADLVLP